MFTLEGKTVLITGAAGGIGAACARVFSSHQARAVAVTDLREESLKALSRDIHSQTGLEPLAIAGDLRDEATVKRIVQSAVEGMGRLDVLVNCAGVSRLGGLYEVTEEQWDFTFDINVKGLFFLCREAFRAMQRQGGGCIVNLSSQAARSGGLVVSPDYPASKAAVLALSKSLAKVGAKHQIRVNTVSPGLIATDMTRDFGYDPASVPLGRIGNGDDVAGACLFLASDYASYITGACVDVNGGIAMI